MALIPVGPIELLTIGYPSYDDVCRVMFDPAGVKRKAEDGFKILRVEKRVYYGVYLNGTIISLGSTFAQFDFYMAHFDILQTHRRYARACLTLMLEVNSGKRPLYADIPDLYPGFRNFLKKFGFVNSGKVPGKFFRKYEVNYAYTRMILYRQ